jgi:hypothetical protein
MRAAIVMLVVTVLGMAFCSGCEKDVKEVDSGRPGTPLGGHA